MDLDPNMNQLLEHIPMWEFAPLTSGALAYMLHVWRGKFIPLYCWLNYICSLGHS